VEKPVSLLAPCDNTSTSLVIDLFCRTHSIICPYRANEVFLFIDGESRLI